MRLLAISGSLRRASTNTAALEALARLAPEGVESLIYRELGALPPFNPDDDEDRPPPQPVETLRTLVEASDALIIAAPGIRPWRAWRIEERARLAGGQRDLRRQTGRARQCVAHAPSTPRRRYARPCRQWPRDLSRRPSRSSRSRGRRRRPKRSWLIRRVREGSWTLSRLWPRRFRKPDIRHCASLLFASHDPLNHDLVLIVDFGSQVTQLIARRVREAGVYCEIHPFPRPARRSRGSSPRR